MEKEYRDILTIFSGFARLASTRVEAGSQKDEILTDKREKFLFLNTRGENLDSYLQLYSNFLLIRATENGQFY